MLIMFTMLIFTTSLMGILISNTDIQTMTTPDDVLTQNNISTQDGITTLPDTIPSVEIMTQDISTDSDISDQEFLNVLNSTGAIHKIKMYDKAATI